ncbi:MAG: hypothetical protein GXX99_00480 [Clostridiales bacterium]|nr:hypothetical protein [Clostridiales bacterium]
MPIVKVGLHAEPGFERGERVAGPHHPVFRELAEGACHLAVALDKLEEVDVRGRRLVLLVAPGRTSRMAGQGGVNRWQLLGHSGAARLSIRERAGLAPFEVQVEIEPRQTKTKRSCLCASNRWRSAGSSPFPTK